MCNQKVSRDELKILDIEYSRYTHYTVPYTVTYTVTTLVLCMLEMLLE